MRQCSIESREIICRQPLLLLVTESPMGEGEVLTYYVALPKQYKLWSCQKLCDAKKYHAWSCQNVCDTLTFLLDNFYIRFGTKLYRQVVGIHMGTNCAPLVADLLLFFMRGTL